MLAAHVRSTHVHLVVSAGDSPEKVMNDIKAYATRALHAAIPGRQRFWTQHGSTRYLRWERDVIAAIDYVLNQQGEHMEAYIKEPEA